VDLVNVFVTFLNVFFYFSTFCNVFNVFSLTFFSAKCNIYISRLCYDVSVRLSVRLSICDGSALGRGACQEEGRGHLALC